LDTSVINASNLKISFKPIDDVFSLGQGKQKGIQIYTTGVPPGARVIRLKMSTWEALGKLIRRRLGRRPEL
jgi:hypothetical protein